MMNVYFPPLTRPVIVSVRADELNTTGSCLWPFSVGVIVYPVILDSPSLPGSPHLTVAWPFPATADGLIGENGTEGISVVCGSSLRIMGGRGFCVKSKS